MKTVETMVTNCGEAPSAVRNRHEAYGIAAERLAKVRKAVKSIETDTTALLGTLPDPNLPAIESVSSICNSSLGAAAVLIEAAAAMRRTLKDLYNAETFRRDDSTPMEEWANAANFQEATPAEDGENNETEDE